MTISRRDFIKANAVAATAAAAGGLRLAAGAIPLDERSASAVVDTGWLTKSLHCKHYSGRLGAASASSKAMFAAAGVASCLLRAESCSAFAVLGVIRAALAVAAMLADSDAFSSTASASCWCAACATRFAVGALSRTRDSKEASLSAAVLGE